MPRERTGSAFQDKEGRWWARVRFTDANGKRVERKRRAENRSDAKHKRNELLRELEDYGAQSVDGAKMTFAELADHYEETYMVEPEYRDGRKIGGMRSYKNQQSMLKPSRAYFAKRKIRDITHGDIERFKMARLKAKTVQGKDRSVATVNRELSLMRRVLNVALRNRWILRNPFSDGVKALIATADEKPRNRILTRDEENRLLAACTGRVAHLRPLIVCALDTGMRRGEILRLTWKDIDFSSQMLTARSYKNRRVIERPIVMTQRLMAELDALWQRSAKDPAALVFLIKDNFKNGFDTVRTAAGLPDVHYHDLRHCAATRLIQGGMSIQEVGRILGHTQAETTYRYINVNLESVQRAASILDDFNKDKPETVN